MFVTHILQFNVLAALKIATKLHVDVHQFYDVTLVAILEISATPLTGQICVIPIAKNFPKDML